MWATGFSPMCCAVCAAKAERKHLLLMLALANRINGDVVFARQFIQAQKLGTIYGVEAHMIADQTRLTKADYHQSWFAQKARAGGGHGAGTARTMQVTASAR